MKVKCPKCGKEGTLTRRLTISNNKRYFYLYVQHVQTVEGRTKRVWHYYGKIEDVKSIHKNDQNYTQKTSKTEKLKSSSNSQKEDVNNRAGSLARIGRKPPKLVVVGSNPTPPVYAEPRTLRPKISAVTVTFFF